MRATWFPYNTVELIPDPLETGLAIMAAVKKTVKGISPSPVPPSMLSFAVKARPFPTEAAQRRLRASPHRHDASRSEPRPRGRHPLASLPLTM